MTSFRKASRNPAKTLQLLEDRPVRRRLVAEIFPRMHMILKGLRCLQAVSEIHVADWKIAYVTRVGRYSYTKNTDANSSP